MPPVLRRPGALGVALALALTVCAVGAPVVSAHTTVSANQTGAIELVSDGAIELVSDGAGEALVEEWRVALDVLARESNSIVGWHTTSNTSGRITQRGPTTAERPKPRPTQARGDASRVIRIARSHLGADFRMGAVGHQYFDCSGLVYRVYQMAGLLDRVGGARRGATGFYNWFKSRGLVSRANGKPGDLVVYQHKGERVIPHMGIYLGNGRVLSALIQPWGVSVHGISRIKIPFKAFLHVRIGR